MTLDVTPAELTVPTTSFAFVVPGHRRWTLRSVLAVVSRAVGGLPSRAYKLTITNGTNVVAAIAAPDAGTEPGTCTVTWADTQSATVAAGATGFVVAPIVTTNLDAGYVITGTIVNPAAGDTFESAVAWYDYVDTA